MPEHICTGTVDIDWLLVHAFTRGVLVRSAESLDNAFAALSRAAELAGKAAELALNAKAAFED